MIYRLIRSSTNSSTNWWYSEHKPNMLKIEALFKSVISSTTVGVHNIARFASRIFGFHRVFFGFGATTILEPDSVEPETVYKTSSLSNRLSSASTLLRKWSGPQLYFRATGDTVLSMWRLTSVSFSLHIPRHNDVYASIILDLSWETWITPSYRIST